MNPDTWMYYGEMAVSIGVSALTFYWLAMAWQKRKDSCFFLLALSSGFCGLTYVMDLVAARHPLNDEEYLHYWYCRQTTLIVVNLTFLGGLWRLLKYLNRICPIPEVQEPSTVEHVKDT